MALNAFDEISATKQSFRI